VDNHLNYRLLIALHRQPSTLLVVLKISNNLKQLYLRIRIKFSC